VKVTKLLGPYNTVSFLKSQQNTALPRTLLRGISKLLKHLLYLHEVIQCNTFFNNRKPRTHSTEDIKNVTHHSNGWPNIFSRNATRFGSK